MYPLTSGGRPFIKLLSLPHTVQEPSSESSWATHGHSTDHLILMACFMSWTVRQPHTPYIHCHAITHFYSHINFLHLYRILTYALLFNLLSSTYVQPCQVNPPALPSYRSPVPLIRANKLYKCAVMSWVFSFRIDWCDPTFSEPTLISP